MKITELVKKLNYILKEYGNLDCYCAGEYGISDPKVLTDNSIFHGPADLCINTDYLPCSKEDIILYIGDD